MSYRSVIPCHLFALSKRSFSYCISFQVATARCFFISVTTGLDISYVLVERREKGFSCFFTAINCHKNRHHCHLIIAYQNPCTPASTGLPPGVSHPATKPPTDFPPSSSVTSNSLFLIQAPETHTNWFHLGRLLLYCQVGFRAHATYVLLAVPVYEVIT